MPNAGTLAEAPGQGTKGAPSPRGGSSQRGPSRAEIPLANRFVTLADEPGEYEMQDLPVVRTRRPARQPSRASACPLGGDRQPVAARGTKRGRETSPERHTPSRRQRLFVPPTPSLRARVHRTLAWLPLWPRGAAGEALATLAADRAGVSPVWERVQVVRQQVHGQKLYVLQLFSAAVGSRVPVWCSAVPRLREIGAAVSRHSERVRGKAPDASGQECVAGARDDSKGVFGPGQRLNPSAFEKYGTDPELVALLREGERFEFTEEPPGFYRDNYGSAKELSAEVHADILRLRQQWLEGPLSYRPHVVMPLGAIVKGPKFRLVVDGTKAGINDRLSATYTKLDSLEDLLCRLKPDDRLSKFDLADAFFHLPIHSDHADVLGICDPETGAFYRYRYLPFGIASAPRSMQRLAQEIKRILNAHGLQHVRSAAASDYSSFEVVAAYLDDFACRHAGHLSAAEAAEQYESVHRVLAELGCEAKRAKDEPPAAAIEFVGIGVSAVSRRAYVTDDRKSKLADDIAAYLLRPGEVTSRRSIAELTGRLQFVASFVDGGQGLLRALYKARDAFTPTYTHLLDTPSARAAWAPYVQVHGATPTVRAALTTFSSRLFAAPGRTIHFDLANGAGFWQGIVAETDAELDDGRDTREGIPVVTGDASGYGVGAWHGYHRFQHWLPPQLCAPATSSNYRELYVVYLSLLRWGHRWAGRRLLVRSDNSTVVSILRLRHTDSPSLGALFERVKQLAGYHRIELAARHIAGVANGLADRLSRKRLTSDRDDWKLARPEFEQLEGLYGPHDVDAAADPSGHNAHLPRFWSWLDSALEQDWAGLNVYCNPPYSNVGAFVIKALLARDARPTTSGATLVVPDWPNRSWHRLVTKHFTIVRRYPAGTDLFTRRDPSAPALDRHIGPTRWPVLVARLSPRSRFP